MASSAQFVNEPLIAIATINSSIANNTSRSVLTTGSPNDYVTLFTAPATGARIERFTVINTSDSTINTAGMIRVFISTTTEPANANLYLEIPVTAVTPSSTVAGFRSQVTITGGLVLPENATLFVTTSISTATSANHYRVIAEGGIF
jgi:hypothetical protein